MIAALGFSIWRPDSGSFWQIDKTFVAMVCTQNKKKIEKTSSKEDGKRLFGLRHHYSYGNVFCIRNKLLRALTKMIFPIVCFKLTQNLKIITLDSNSKKWKFRAHSLINNCIKKLLELHHFLKGSQLQNLDSAISQRITK